MSLILTATGLVASDAPRRITSIYIRIGCQMNDDGQRRQSRSGLTANNNFKLNLRLAHVSRCWPRLTNPRRVEEVRGSESRTVNFILSEDL